MKMYKLFVNQFTKRISPHGVFFVQKQIIVQHSMRLCSFCNFYHRKIPKFIKHHPVRGSTTTANILDHSPIKKKNKQRSKKYTELLAVTNETTSSMRTKLCEATASDFLMLVDQPDIVSNDPCNKDSLLDKASGLGYVTNNNCNVCDKGTNLDIVKNTNISTKKGVIGCTQFPDTSVGNKEIITNERSSKVSKLNVNRTTSENGTVFEKGHKYTLQHYVEHLTAYMQVYVSCGMLSRANRTLMRYRKYIQNQIKQHDKYIGLYNILLEAYALRKKVSEVLDLYDTIKKDSIIPIPQTYAYIFDALGRDNINVGRIGLLNKLHIDMNNYNITFNDIFNESYFKNDQRENILKSVRILIPNFEPSYTEISTTYKCKLLNNIPIKCNYESPAEGLLTVGELKNLLQVQVQNECTIQVQIPSIEVCNENEKTNSALKKKIMEVERYWRNAALTAFERNLKSLKEKENQSHNNLMVLYPFLEVLNKEDYVDAILREVRQIARGSETYSISLKLLHTTLGRYIYKKYEVQAKKKSGVLDKIVSVYMKYLGWYLNPKSMAHLTNVNDRIIWQYFEQQEACHGPSLNSMCMHWPPDVIVDIGKFLYNIVLNDIILQPDMLIGHDLKCSIPAFYTLFRNKGNHLSEQIKPHPFVSKLYKESHLETLSFDSLVLPLHIPPRPWTSMYTGGYVITKTDFIRIPDYSEATWKKLQNTPTEQLVPIFDSLNQLGSVPWKVNIPLLDIITKIFQDGGSVELNVPQSVSALAPPPPISKNATAEEKQKASIAMSRYKQKKYDAYSLWCDTLYKLSIANHFRNKIFWLPHNLDFRGRVYPVPPYLNHLSSDLGRSLLLFAKGKPLGPNGLNWLKLHVINLTNFKKGRSVKERIEFANENMDNILDSAKKPLTGKRWWAQSEEPWQTLAGCMEIAKALQAPNIEEYVSTFPVHQDGSCNGLQHYAALGRDQIGAESVNLYPFDAPRDVYTGVASIVEERRKCDAQNNVKIAKVLQGSVKRKVIKQTVMTTVYGVTKYGAKLQIARQLKDKAHIAEEFVWPASTYLAECTFHSLRTMFKSAREIQDWFTECARIISSICSQNVEWITPLGLPIVQPYMKQKMHKNYYIKGNEKPDVMKQRNAFAPNFIHSLDSTHMMLTSLYCDRENVTFVSVHDCFWTHPCTVEIMNRICREQFVALHSEPILEDLAKFFVQRYAPIYEKLQKSKKNTLPDVHKCLTSVPSKGTFDIKKVLSSTYFFN